ncbi:MAG: glucosaminidase domain-containing protein [Gammaproteobacteria bacterium]|nr:glucosaminidase domain-containing protein [Gammaproteobacteria bacterium]
MKKAMVLSGLLLPVLFGSVSVAQTAAASGDSETLKLAALTEPVKKYSVHKIPKNMTVAEKKERFKQLLLPPVRKVYRELNGLYSLVKSNIETGNRKGVDELKAVYEVETDQELLMALKPHPISIVLAQAAMESSWATSRFIREGNNAFGVWSYDPSEPRMAAGETRGKKTVWVKKYKSLEDSVRDNYMLLAKSKAYREFRQLRMQTSDPHALVKKLHRYSEIGAKYGSELSSIIRYNAFDQHDLG